MAGSAVAGPLPPRSASSPLVLLLTLFCFFGFSFALDDFWLLPGAALSSAALLAEMPSPAALLAPATASIARVRPTTRRHTTNRHSAPSLLMRTIESPVPLVVDGSVHAFGPKQAYPVTGPPLSHRPDVSPISRYRGVAAFYRAASATMQKTGLSTNHGRSPPRPDLLGPLGISTGL